MTIDAQISNAKLKRPNYQPIIFPEKPTDAFVQEFIKFVRETGCPEEFPGLFWGTISEDEEYILLKKDFQIDIKKRAKRDRAFCPRCNQKNKYLKGSLAYFPHLKIAAAIGNECASNDVQDQAEKLYKQQERVSNARKYLLNNVAGIPKRLEILKSSSKAAREARRLFLRIRQESDQFHTQLKAAKRNNGKLSVVREIKGELSKLGMRQKSSPTGETSISTIEVEIGNLIGLTMAQSNYDPIKELKEITSILTALPDELIRNKDNLENFLSLSSDQFIEDSYKLLSKSDKKFKSYQDRIQDFLSFFERHNISLLNRWGTHEDNPLNIKVEMITHNGRQCLIIDEERYVIFPEMFISRFRWPVFRE